LCNICARPGEGGPELTGECETLFVRDGRGSPARLCPSLCISKCSLEVVWREPVIF